MKKVALMLLPIVGLAGCDQFGAKPVAAVCTQTNEPMPTPDGKGVPPSAATIPGAGGNAQAVSMIAQQMAFQLCTARANKWIDDQYYRQEMTALRQGSLAAMGVKIPEVTAPVAKPAEQSANDPLSASTP